MRPETGFLSAEERQVVNLLIEAGELMSQIYLRQVAADNPQTRQALANSRRADRDQLLAMFDLHFGPWDTLADKRPSGARRRTRPAPAFTQRTSRRKTSSATSPPTRARKRR
jgi:hypothetical protein